MCACVADVRCVVNELEELGQGDDAVELRDKIATAMETDGIFLMTCLPANMKLNSLAANIYWSAVASAEG